MSVPTKDGAWVSTKRVVRLDCTKCGTVTTTEWPLNEREEMELIRKHAQAHGGIDHG